MEINKINEKEFCPLEKKNNPVILISGSCCPIVEDIEGHERKFKFMILITGLRLFLHFKKNSLSEVYREIQN